MLVRCYHGFGDTLQFIRFVPQLAAIARSVIVEAQAELLSLLRSIPGAAALYPLGGELPEWDVAIESMELAHALRLRLSELPGRVPYLVRPPAREALCDCRRAAPGICGSGWCGPPGTGAASARCRRRCCCRSPGCRSI
ncbi:MAG TPA: hypothetical protein VGP52_18120, partial [Stellaceae bacterium]|nr:hypothetical protein [Stellaceae bacterium]